MDKSHWESSAVCNDSAYGVDVMFGSRSHMKIVRSRLCVVCPVIEQCLVAGMDGKTEFGVFGGLVPGERKKLRDRFKEVTSWKEFLEELAQRHPAAPRTAIVYDLYKTAGIKSFFTRTPLPAIPREQAS